MCHRLGEGISKQQKLKYKESLKSIRKKQAMKKKNIDMNRQFKEELQMMSKLVKEPLYILFSLPSQSFKQN